MEPKENRNTWRVFVALPISEEVRAALWRRQGELEGSFDRKSANFVNPEGIHLTLKFIGECSPAIIPPVAELLKKELAGAAPIRLSVAGTGVFPTPSAPRVLYAKVADEPAGALAALQKKVEEACAQAGFARESKPFKPHLTIARLKNLNINHYKPLRVEPDSPLFGEFTADMVNVYRSFLYSTGAQYKVIESIDLKGR